ncbi:MAG: thioredoxin family protein [Treponema sp.]|uniref:thioredoxin family protein n=1 Tax=Treponema sp. TaxID=166 RepID=UPI00298DE882|nr:thioredoxin family protein [Treponema sp.]MCQ2601643.1 thioredoxin family protein [Treponema sp.]
MANEGCCCCGNSDAKVISSIKVLGSGCTNCHKLHQNVIDACAEINLATDIEFVTDMEKIAGYGVMSMPCIVINEKIASVGKVLSKDEIIKLLK